MSFNSKYVQANKKLPFFMRVRPVGPNWPRFFTIKEYQQHYTTAMRITHLFYLVAYAAVGLLFTWFFYQQELSLKTVAFLALGLYIIVSAILSLPFGWWLARNLRSNR